VWKLLLHSFTLRQTNSQFSAALFRGRNCSPQRSPLEYGQVGIFPLVGYRLSAIQALARATLIQSRGYESGVKEHSIRAGEIPDLRCPGAGGMNRSATYSRGAATDSGTR
jgi:hypothetical protein